VGCDSERFADAPGSGPGVKSFWVGEP